MTLRPSSFTWKAKTHLCWNLIWRQLHGNRHFSLSMIFNMSLGLIGYLTVASFNQSFLAETSKKTQQIAGGDLVITSRQPLDFLASQFLSQFIANARQQNHFSEEVSLTSMATSSEITSLVELRFVDQHFPLYSGLELLHGGKISSRGATSLGHHQIWVYRELLARLDVKVGEFLKIGDVEFQIADVVIDDPSTGSGVFSISPRIFARAEDLPDTRLTQGASRVLYAYRVVLPTTMDIDLIGKQVKSTIQNMKLKTDVRVKTHKEVTDDIVRVQRYLTDYLSLIALTSLFLSAIGAAYLMRVHLDSTVKEFAILASLGADRHIPRVVFLGQCVLLGVASALIAIAISFVTLPILAFAMRPLVGSIELKMLSVSLFLYALSFAILMGILLTLPQLLKLGRLSPSFLFQESVLPTGGRRPWDLAAYLPAVCVWWVTSIFQAKSYYNGTVFALACVLAAAMLALVAIPLSKMAIMLANKVNLNWRVSLALRSVSRNRVASISSFLALSIGTTLIVVVPQLRAVVEAEISRPSSEIPQLFMFDIQDDQIDAIKNLLSDLHAQMGQEHPMVRARLEKINDEPIERRKVELEGENEQQQRENLQSRTQNLSFRARLSSAETIVSGEYFKERFEGSGIPGLSIEEGFAKRLSLSLGDVLGFDISGVAFVGKVTSIRKVRWTSFEPNFMILTQPGALDDAPKIWVTSASRLDPAKLTETQALLAKTFSNVSVVDIKDTVRRLLSFVDQISVAVNVVAWLSLFGGAGVLYSIAYANALRRFRTLAILKTLGATTQDALLTILMEYSFITGGAVIFGMFLGALTTWLLATQVLKAQPTYQVMTDHYIALLIFPISIVLAYVASRRATRVEITTLLN